VRSVAYESCGFTKSYLGEVEVLAPRRVDLIVRTGEFVVLLDPSGEAYPVGSGSAYVVGLKPAGLRAASALGEYRYNHRFHRLGLFETFLGLAARRGAETYRAIVSRDARSPTCASERCTTYSRPESAGLGACPRNAKIRLWSQNIVLQFEEGRR
jgi:hypothetical protein